MNSRSRTRWVTFDCFGTLVDWQNGFARLLAPLAGASAGDLVRAYHTCERQVSAEAPHRPYKHVLAASLQRAAAETGVALPAADMHGVAAGWRCLTLFEDVEPMLAELRARGLRLAVLTNCDDDLFEITHRTFRWPFDLFVTAERVRGYKPAPWHFRAFRKMTGASPGDWVHVACSWYHDVAPARALGVPCVWLDRERTGEDAARASVRVVSGAEVPDAVTRLLAGSAADYARPLD